ncbi:DUF6479 family protein [Streptomyces sp. NPDC006692]|uniref:DUF6479 family protein n=1 Tax=unclassified Streptomyces TaxID=2593676 RepID=UPI0036CF407D
MTIRSKELALTHGLVVGAVPLAVGLVIVALLIGAVWWGLRRQARAPRPPRPEEQPRPPASGPVGAVVERREPAEMPRGRVRLTPHQFPGFGNHGTRPAKTQPSTEGDNERGGDNASRRR